MKIVETIRNTSYRLSERPENEVVKKVDTQQSRNIISVDKGKYYQTIMGFGGAITEASAVTLNKMSPDQRKKALRLYYDPDKGLNYTLGRISIHSCDFALGNYTYVKEKDATLKSFDISRDHKTIIPLINEIHRYTNKPLILLASPWSPPAWMKTTNEMNHGGKLLEKYQDTWAYYYTKFIKAYEEQGISIWGITVQNEPEAVQQWESCIYTGAEERDFIKYYLGPIMHQEGLENIKILIWDHNRDVMVERVSIVLSDPEAAKYIWGTGFHWYVSEAFDHVGQVCKLFPDKHLLFTEGCQEGGVHLGSWKTGERYGRNMIGDMNNGCEGYIDWNIVLDETGGPNHVNNLCDAPIIADTTTNQLHINSSYYYIGHFSKYVLPGAVRMSCQSTHRDLYVIAFMNLDYSMVVIVMNETDNLIEYELNIQGEILKTTSEGHAIRTYIISR